ncbi:MAG: signal peptide protein [Schlesneria sp.]|nr:signal peptide protein [Schlesneria sp.]
MVWGAVLLTLMAAIYDLRTREIPDWISAALLMASVTVRLASISTGSWVGLLLGFAVGSAIGLLLFALGAWGGGDVKLVAAIGAALELEGLLITFFWMALAGAVLGLVSASRRQREFAYGPAIACGVWIYAIQAAWH